MKTFKEKQKIVIKKIIFINGWKSKCIGVKPYRKAYTSVEYNVNLEIMKNLIKWFVNMHYFELKYLKELKKLMDSFGMFIH